MRFVESSGINLQEQFLGYVRRELKGFRDFMVGIQECLLLNTKRMFTQVGDIWLLRVGDIWLLGVGDTWPFKSW